MFSKLINVHARLFGTLEYATGCFVAYFFIEIRLKYEKILGIYNFGTYLAGRSALLALSLSIIYHYREFPLRSSSYFSFSPHFSFMPLPVECSNISCRDFMLRCCSFHHRCFVLFIMSQHLNEECKKKKICITSGLSHLRNCCPGLVATLEKLLLL